MAELYDNCYKELSNNLTKDQQSNDDQKKLETILKFVKEHVNTVMSVF
jgi:hypothetical protein